MLQLVNVEIILTSHMAGWFNRCVLLINSKYLRVKTAAAADRKHYNLKLWCNRKKLTYQTENMRCYCSIWPADNPQYHKKEDVTVKLNSDAACEMWTLQTDLRKSFSIIGLDETSCLWSDVICHLNLSWNETNTPEARCHDDESKQDDHVGADRLRLGLCRRNGATCLLVRVELTV